MKANVSLSSVTSRAFLRTAIVGLFVLFPVSILGQSVNSVNTTTPTGMAPGSPAGSYALSDFDTISPFSGRMNFRLPLLKIGGRGKAGYTITQQIEQTWVAQRMPIENSSYTPQYASYNWWTPSPGYGPGFMQVRTVAQTRADCQPPANPLLEKYTQSQTRLTFTSPDGTEYEFIDALNTGAVLTNEICSATQNYNRRGRVWITTDGSSATFITDGDVYDNQSNPNAGVMVSQQAGSLPVSGFMYLRDGTEYRIDNTRVSWIRDSNGNKITFVYSANGLVITDSLNRQVTITYGSPDVISFPGSNGVTRQIKIWHDTLDHLLRSDFPLPVKTPQQLFPSLDGSSTTPFNPSFLVSQIQLPDMRFYQFKYNYYGELARVVLPTGGAFEYDWGRGPGASAEGTILEGSYTGLYNVLEIYRRISERRVYKDGTTLESRMVFTPTHSHYNDPRPWTTTVKVEEKDAAGTLLAASIHYYKGSPSASMVKHTFDFTEWDEGKESQTDTLASDGVTVLRRTIMDWRQRATGPFGLFTHSFFLEGQMDPRMVESTSTLMDVTPNRVSKQTHIDPSNGAVGYDQYNNPTDAWEYDFGSGSPGALIRHTHTSYLTANNGINYATVNNSFGQPNNVLMQVGSDQPNAEKSIHIRSLPVEQTVMDANDVVRAKTTYEYDTYTQSGCNGQNTNCDNDLLMDRPSIFGLSARVDNPSTPYNPLTDFYRGNVTRVSRYLLANTGLIGAGGNQNDLPYSSFAHYDIAGNVVAGKDANGNYSQIGYSGTYQYAYPTSTTSPIPDTDGTFGSNQSLTTTTTYDFSTGKPLSITDANLKVTTFEYNDPLDRLTRVVRPSGGGETLYKYGLGDGAPETSGPVDNRYIRTRTKQNATGDYLDDNVRYDGLGRTIRSAHCELIGSGTACVKWSARDTQYDGLGRVVQVSNPEVIGGGSGIDFETPSLPANCNGNSTICWTTNTYDALGRVTKITTPDGSHADTVYAGNKVTVIDQAGKQRSSFTDALGRLIQVNEDPNGISGSTPLNYQTNYTYDVLGNLTLVRQGGFPTSNSTDPTVQFRRFYYDSLSRLAYARNPEQDATIPFNPPGESGVTWTMKYEYDANGNLSARTEPRLINGFNVTTSYDYDALNRNIMVSYGDGVTAGVRRYYDGATNNGKGRLWRVESDSENPSDLSPAYSKTAINGYDDVGRVTSQTQSFWKDGVWKNFTVTRNSNSYDLVGHLLQQGYPSGKSVNYAYNIGGRLTTLSGNLASTSNTTYMSGATYNAAGQMGREIFGSSTQVNHNNIYNKRFQMVETSLGNNSLDPTDWNLGKLRFFYSSAATASEDPKVEGTDNNGNVLRQEHWVPTSVTSGKGTQPTVINSYAVPMRDDYAYDAINRLTQVKGWQRSTGTATPQQIYQQGYDYDKFGNRKLHYSTDLNDQYRTWGNGITGSQTADLYDVNKLTNRLMGMVYDAAGNLRSAQSSTRFDNRIYDAENRMTYAKTGVNPGSYVYDGDGRRVRRIVNGVETWQVYGIDGELLAEYAAATTTPQKEYGYRGGQLLITAESNGQVKWLVSDHLGTPRMIVDSNGALAGVTRHDYLPFGEELTPTMGGIGTSPPIVRNAAIGYAMDTVRQKFSLEERDTETGLDYFGARYFTSLHGRFTSADPIIVTEDRLSEPQRLNLYLYCRNNPLRYVDPKGLDDYEYDQSGRETSHVKRGFWYNLWNPNTFKLNADNGKTYNLEGPLKELKNGERYTLIDENQTAALMKDFEKKNEHKPGQPSISYEEVIHRSMDPKQWNWKIELNKKYRHGLFVYQNIAHPSDYIGNVVWGYIMASYGFDELTARIGAGAQQVASGRIEGGPLSFGDDPRDQEAIGKGFDDYRDDVRRIYWKHHPHLHAR